jgi:hypothetical protein
VAGSSNPTFDAFKGHVLRVLLYLISILEFLMDDKPHKAHRPAQSGGKADKKEKGKGKGNLHGFNEKVRTNHYPAAHLTSAPGVCSQIWSTGRPTRTSKC